MKYQINSSYEESNGDISPKPDEKDVVKHFQYPESPKGKVPSKVNDLMSAPVSLAQLSPGDSLNLTCISEHSEPAADLSWLINGQKVK